MPEAGTSEDAKQTQTDRQHAEEQEKSHDQSHQDGQSGWKNRPPEWANPEREANEISSPSGWNRGLESKVVHQVQENALAVAQKERKLRAREQGRNGWYPPPPEREKKPAFRER